MNNAKARFNEEIIRIKDLSLISKFLKENEYPNQEHYDEINRNSVSLGCKCF